MALKFQEALVSSTIATILVGSVIFVFITVGFWVTLRLFYRGSLVIVRFFDDTSSGRQLMRQAGNPPRLAKEEEAVLRRRLVTVAAVTGWARYLFVGVVLATAALAAHFSTSPVFDARRFLTTSLAGIALQTVITITVIAMHLWSRHKVIDASRQVDHERHLMSQGEE
jgi:hypothetical protein